MKTSKQKNTNETMKIKEKATTATEENVYMILNCEPVPAAAGSTVVGLGIISPLHQNMD